MGCHQGIDYASKAHGVDYLLLLQWRFPWDKDGDIGFLTDNNILVANMQHTPTLMCAQKTAQKSVITEDLLVQANIASFGNEVGKITNWVTSMYDVRAQFDPESEEYKILDYRIKCGQQYQQNTMSISWLLAVMPIEHAVNL